MGTTKKAKPAKPAKPKAKAEAKPIEEPKVLLSGAAKMKLAGKRGIMLSVTQPEYDALKQRADADRRALSAWIVTHCLRSPS